VSKPSLEITTMIGCPLMCNYCPQDSLRDAYGDDIKYMSLDDFKTIVDKVPQDVRLDFSGQAEPWVNPACTDMVEYALQKGFQLAIFTTLYNWDGVTVNRMSRLLLDHAPQIEIFKIHFPDEKGNMRGWQPSNDWNYAYLAMSIIMQNTGIYCEAMTMSDDGVHPAIKDLPFIGLSHDWGTTAIDRAGTLNRKKVKGQPLQVTPRHKRPVTCGKTTEYNQRVILPNGEVLLCCMDYAKKHVIGNLLTEHEYQDLDHTAEMKRIREINSLNRFSKETLCKSCTYACPL
jgi:radical SAM protein with 4Fe4S-binding SPASM domain